MLFPVNLSRTSVFPVLVTATTTSILLLFTNIEVNIGGAAMS